MSRDWESVLDWHWHSFPIIQAQDWYKLVHQSVFGIGHLFAPAPEQDARGFLEIGLQSEAKHLGERLEYENLVDPVDLEERLVRLNLRPYSYLVNDLKVLVPVMVATAQQVQGDLQKMSDRLEQTRQWLEAHEPERVRRFEWRVRRGSMEGFPLVSHSRFYRSRYQPAYRVVLQHLVPDTLPSEEARRAFANRIEYDRRVMTFRRHGYDGPSVRALIVERATPLGRNVLEVGTGNGALTMQLARESIHLVTVDRDAEAQARAKLNLMFVKPAARLEFLAADAELLPFPDQSFDTVISAHSFHHFREPEKVLPEMARVCRDKLVIADFNRRGFEVVRSIHRSEGSEHEEIGGTLDPVLAWLRQHAFQVVRQNFNFVTVLIARPGAA